MKICLDQRTGSGCHTQNPDQAQSCQNCGASLRFALPIHDPGTQVSRFRIIGVLGYGGFGAVYDAEDLQGQWSRVALKETFDPVHTASYRSEFAVLSRLQHPHLPQYYAMFEAEDNGYLVMELIPGQSLADILQKQRQPLPENQVLAYAYQLCSVLHYLHTQQPPIIHRDIKPANIRLTPEGLIKLVDFGLLKQGAGATETLRRGLTPVYAPIEQWGSQPGHTDPRSDIYSLAATLYHLFTAKRPLPPAPDRLGIQPDPLPPPTHLNPNLSPHISQTIMRAMAPYHTDRFPDITRFERALSGVTNPVVSTGSTVSRPVANRAVSAGPTDNGATEILAPPIWQSPRLWAGGVGFIVMLLLCSLTFGSGIFLMSGSPPIASTSQPSAAVAINEATATLVSEVMSPENSPPTTETPLPENSPAPIPSLNPLPTPTPNSPFLTGKLVQTGRLGRGQIRDTALATEANLLAVASEVGVWLYDAETLEVIDFIETETHVYNLDITPDGILAMQVEKTVSVWHMPENELLNSWEVAQSGISSLAISPDGEIVATEDDNNNQVQLWSVTNGDLLANFETEVDGYIDNLVFSSDGLILAASVGDGSSKESLHLWQVSDGTLIQTINLSSKSIITLAFSPDNSLLSGCLLSQDNEGSISLWQVSDRKRRHTLVIPDGVFWQLAFSPDSQTLASGDYNKVQLWDTVTGDRLKTLEIDNTPYYGLYFSADSEILITVDSGIIQQWRISDGALLRTVHEHMGQAREQIAFSPEGKTLAVSGEYEDFIWLWDVITEELQQTIASPHDVDSMALSPDGALLAVAGSQSIIDSLTLWQLPEGERLNTINLEDEPGDTKSLAFSPDSTILAIGMGDELKRVELRQMPDGTLINTLEGHPDKVDSVAISPDGTLLASGSEQTIYLWQLPNGELLKELKGHTGNVTNLVFSNDGTWLASGGDETIRIWQMPDGSVVEILTLGYDDWVSSVAFSPDGAVVVGGEAADYDYPRPLHIWRTSDWEELDAPEGITEDITSLSFSPDGETLAVAAGSVVQLWQVSQ